MKKLIFCCLVVLIGSCKDKNDDPEPEIDYAPEFVGNYETTTVVAGTVAKQSWEVAAKDKNVLSILYIKNSEIPAAGTTVTLEQKYDLQNVKTTSDGLLEINETVDVVQSNGKPLQQKVEGIGTKGVNASGAPQISITIKVTESGTGKSSEEFLEFKKK